MLMSNTKLLKRAHHGGKNLVALAFLAGLGTFFFGITSAYAGPHWGLPAIMTGVFAMLTVAYGLLSAAANRGDHKAVGIVVGMMTAQLAVALVGYAIGPKQPLQLTEYSGLTLILCLLILLVLTRSYRVLVELRKRGLWDQVFGACPPSYHLRAVGGTLLVTALLICVAASFYVTRQAKATLKEAQAVQAFVKMIRGEEQEFMASMQAFRTTGPQGVDAAMERLKRLEVKAAVLAGESVGMKPLETVLEKYSKAIGEWKNGLEALKRADPNVIQTQMSLQHGDELREEATRIFDLRYAAK